MRLVIVTLTLVILLGGMGLAGEQPTAPATNNVSGPSLLALVGMQLSLWLGIDLFGNPELPEDPQLDDGKHITDKNIVPIRDSGSASADL